MNFNIVSCEWLYNYLDEPNLVILDASQQEYISGNTPEFEGIQIKGARHFDLKDTFSNKKSKLPNMLLSPDTFAENARILGINQNSKIVVYDSLGIYTSPRIWWMFKTMGHEKIAVLDGGLPEWVKFNYPTEPTNSSAFELGDFVSNFNEDLVTNVDMIIENLDTEQAIIIDARSEGRFGGWVPEPRKELRGGHIPGSINMPYDTVLCDGKMRSVEELQHLFISLNLDTRPMIFSCGSGVTACIILLAMDLVAKNPKAVYDGSWTEWATLSDLPVMKMEKS